MMVSGEKKRKLTGKANCLPGCGKIMGSSGREKGRRTGKEALGHTAEHVNGGNTVSGNLWENVE